MDQKQMDEIRLKVREYDPRPRAKMPEQVYLVWRREEYEHPSMIAVCTTIPRAKIEAESAARKWDRKIGPWQMENKGGHDYLYADVEPVKPLTEYDHPARISYTIETEQLLR